MMRVVVLTCVFGCLLAGCGLKGPLYDPAQRERQRAEREAIEAQSETGKQGRTGPAPQSQKEDRERASDRDNESLPAQDTNQPAAPQDPDRSTTTTRPAGRP
jgi:predicted small lipoprotein YifL